MLHREGTESNLHGFIIVLYKNIGRRELTSTVLSLTIVIGEEEVIVSDVLVIRASISRYTRRRSLPARPSAYNAISSSQNCLHRSRISRDVH